MTQKVRWHHDRHHTDVGNQEGRWWDWPMDLPTLQLFWWPSALHLYLPVSLLHDWPERGVLWGRWCGDRAVLWAGSVCLGPPATLEDPPEKEPGGQHAGRCHGTCFLSLLCPHPGEQGALWTAWVSYRREATNRSEYRKKIIFSLLL